MLIIKKYKGHIQDTIAKIEPHDSVERFEALGVKIDYPRICSNN